MNTEELGGYADAVKRFRGNLSPRADRMLVLESYVKGTQYSGRKSWWDLSVPLQERAPCLQYPVVKISIQSNVDMCMGEGRYPTITTKVAEDEEEDDNGLSPEESKDLDRFIREYHRASKFKSGSRETFGSAQAMGSAACVHGVRNGRPFQDLIPAKWCEPKLDQEGNVLSLAIQYPYLEQVKGPDGKWTVHTKLYRRVIDDKTDTEYLPADAPEDGVKISWRKNPDRSVDHNLGFCPVIWYPFMKGCVPTNVVDGEAVHAGLFQEIEAHDFAISMRHRAALYSGDPQLVEIGVEMGFNPSAGGRTPIMYSTPNGGAATEPTGENPVTGGYMLGPSQARKRGASQVWQYENPEAQPKLLTLPGDALNVVDDNAKDIRLKLQEALAVVFIDPTNIKIAATTSGKALHVLKQRQLDRCDQYRDDLTTRFFEPSVSMQLRLAHTLISRGERLTVPGADKVESILSKFADANEWQTPTLQIVWGPYFAPDPAEQQQIVAMVLAALQSTVPVLTVRLALQKLAPIFNIENLSAIEEALEEESEKRKQAQLDQVKAEQQALHQLAQGASDGGGGAGTTGTKLPRIKKPEKYPQKRGNRAAAITPQT